jgi:hypothetical protein
MRHGLSIFLLIIFATLTLQRYYDGETDYNFDLLDYQSSYIVVYATKQWPGMYLGIKGRGRTFHLLMYHNTSYFIELADTPNVWTSPMAIQETILSGDSAGRPDAGNFRWDFGINTTDWLRFGGIYDVYNVTIGYINATLPIPWVSTPISFVYKVSFLDTPHIVPLLKEFRAEDLHPAAYACVLAFFLFVFFVCLLFSQHQPLKSRRFVPALACLLQFGMLLPSCLTFIPRPVLAPVYEFWFWDITYWLVQNYTRYATIMLFMLLSVSMSIRFVILQNVNARKQLFMRDHNTDVTDVKWTWKMLKLLGNPWITLTLMIFFYFLFAGYLSFGWINDDTRSHYWFFASLPAIMVLAFLTLVGDMLTNFHRIKKCQWAWIWSEDIFYFRVELYVITIFVMLPWFIFWYIIFSDDNFPQWYYVNNTLNGLIFAIHTVSFFLFFVFQVGFVLVITIWQFCTQKCANRNRREDTTGVLKSALENPDSNALFQQYSQNEFAVENISCWGEIQQYKTTSVGKGAIGTRIIKLYFSGSASELEINVSATAQGALATKKIGLNITEDNMWPNDLFAEVESDLIGNLADTFSRFRTTANWKNFVKGMKFMDEIYGTNDTSITIPVKV